MEARPERVRHHLRRPLPSPRNLLAKNAGNTVNEIDLKKNVKWRCRQADTDGFQRYARSMRYAQGGGLTARPGS